MKIIHFIRDDWWGGFTPFKGKEQVYGTDLLIIDGNRYHYNPKRPKPADSEHFLSYDKEDLLMRTLGLSDRRIFEDYLLLETKVLKHIINIEDIVLFTDSWKLRDDVEFLSYLKTKKEFNLHVITVINENYVSNDYRELLRIFPSDNCTSICYMNIWECSKDDEDDNEDYEEQLFHELKYILAAISDTDRAGFSIYDHEKKEYIRCAIPIFWGNSMFEFITPTVDEDICQRLYEYRKAYASKHDLKFDQKPCIECECHNECGIVCDECDSISWRMWDKVNIAPYHDYVSGSQNYPYQYNDIEALINGIDRMRIDTDGNGIRTLILMAGCPLNCRYCGNKQFKEIFPVTETKSVDDMEYHLHKDAIYFEATNGGLTFGGGEPLMQADFIHEMHSKYPMWSIDVETSLYCGQAEILKLADDIDHWFVDIKDMDPDIYKKYTGSDIWTMLDNLQLLIKTVPTEKITVRVPLISNYNTEDDVEKSVRKLKDMGFLDIETFKYSIM